MSVAVVVLAAGSSRRMTGDDPKQLRDWHGQTLVSRAAHAAVESELGPVILVTGYRSADVAAVVSDLDLRIVLNEIWAQGQGTSVAAGVRALPDDAEAAVFLPCDQPGVEARHLRRVARPWMRADAESRPAAVVPVYDGQQGAPVLFDRRVFPRLEKLYGDAGGRVLLDDLRYEVHEVEMDDPEVGRDVDTEEDYEKLSRRNQPPEDDSLPATRW